MTLRDKRQVEFAKMWLENPDGILNLCPRFGKCRTAIHALKQMPKETKILLAYPDLKIKQAWVDEFNATNYSADNVTFTTHLSLKKHVDEDYDLLILDEIHLLSEAQIEVCKEIMNAQMDVMGLTGTLASDTQETLLRELGLGVLAEYSIAQAIEEKVIVDYEIIVHTTPLDNIKLNAYKQKKRTEKKQFDALSWAIEQCVRENKSTMFLRLARMRLIQNSIAKVQLTKKLLDKFKDERVLVFCGLTKISDDLGIPSYHSKSSEKQLFQDFASGHGNHLAVVKIGNSGVTYKPLNRLIINYFDSNAENLAQKINRCMGFEYNNPDKKAYIHIVSTNETVELKWLSKALEFFDEEKIKYVR